jgi:hypothetical protein
MLDLLEGLRAWPLLIVALVVFGFLPGVVLRIILLAFRRRDPRRAEILAELRAVPRWERPFWVAEQIEVALFEGLLERIKAAVGRRARSPERIGPSGKLSYPITIEEAWEKGASIPFTRHYAEHTLISKKTYPQGLKVLIARPHRGPLGKITHVDVRLADGQRVREVPIDYFLV